MQVDKQKIILWVTKYVSYLINTAIILAVMALVGGWIYLLYRSAISD